MHGNVAEWCLDDKHANYVGAPTDGSAWGRGGGCQRGGAYDFRVSLGRSSSRLFWSRSVTVSGFGFRVVAELSPVIGNGHISVISAASYSGPKLAAESIAALFATNLSSDTEVASSVPLPTTLAGSSVYIKDSGGNEYLSPLFFTSPNQINIQVPAGPKVGIATIVAVNNGSTIANGSIEITNVSPGLFSADASGKGLAAALVLRIKSNGEQIFEPITKIDASTGRVVAVPIDLSHPADQVFLICFGTGMRNRSSLSNVQSAVGGMDVEPLFVGPQGNLAGLDQCNLRLPQSLAGRGAVEIEIQIDGVSANRVIAQIK